MKNLVFFGLFLCFISCSSDENIIWIKLKGGEFVFGDNEGKENESPGIPIKVKDFYLSETEITNAQFNSFVQATAYITEAEKLGHSLVFKNGEWNEVKGMTWRNAFSQNKVEHPVVHLTLKDMNEFCDWAGGRLPSEIELEYAMQTGGVTKMNIWTGNFPDSNDLADGFETTNLVKAYGPDNNLVYGLKGNVWEQCADVYHFEVHDKLAFAKKSSQSAYEGQGYDLGLNSNSQDYYVIKGGSFLCHKSYCSGYRPIARQKRNQHDSYSHIGFRMAKDID